MRDGKGRILVVIFMKNQSRDRGGIMQRYMNYGGDSGVEGFEIGTDYIEVKFKTTRRTYTYSYASAGREVVEHMKTLAKGGEGLNEFIKKCVNDKYVK